MDVCPPPPEPPQAEARPADRRRAARRPLPRRLADRHATARKPGERETETDRAPRRGGRPAGCDRHRRRRLRNVGEIDDVGVDRAARLRGRARARHVDAAATRRRGEIESARGRCAALDHERRSAQGRPVDGQGMVDPDVVHEQLGGARGRRIGWAGPVAPHCQVQDREERAVVDPRIPGGHVPLGADEEDVAGVVHVELDHARRPEHSVCVESRVDPASTGEGVVLAEPLRTGVARAVERRPDRGGSEARARGARSP